MKGIINNVKTNILGMVTEGFLQNKVEKTFQLETKKGLIEKKYSKRMYLSEPESLLF